MTDPSKPWYETQRRDCPSYEQELNAWKTRIQRGEPGVLGQARDMLAATEYMPWYASPVYQDAQFFLMAHLAGSPDPTVWSTLWRELMDEHASDPRDQQQAWQAVRHPLMLHALGPGHPAVLLEYLEWNRTWAQPHVWTGAERRGWIKALIGHDTDAEVVSAPPANDPERTAGTKLLALIDAGHLTWDDVQQVSDPPLGPDRGNPLWGVPGMRVALERGLREGVLSFDPPDARPLWNANDQTLWDLAERLAPHALDQGMAIVQNDPGWPTSLTALQGDAPVSQRAWLAIQQRGLRAALPIDESLPRPRSSRRL